MRVLLLGGTTEASALAERLAGDDRFDVTLSLAGRTEKPLHQPLPARVGGFGGAEGLAQWLTENRIDALIDATHPYAARISANAVAATHATGVPLASIMRAPWRAEAGDRWTEVAGAVEAVSALGDAPRRIFLALGRLELAAFAAAPQHNYIVRTIDPPRDIPLPPRMTLIQARGPFKIADEQDLLEREQIAVVVSKNSGGAATYAKVAAARTLGIPVVMIARPEKPHGTPLVDIEEAQTWLEKRLGHERAPGSLRGV